MTTHAIETTPRRTPSNLLHDPLPGTRYRAVRRIGAGTTSEVFEAVGPDRARCAVKVLRAVYADTPDAVFRMEQEGHALAGLDHPSLVPVIDVGTTSAGRPFFVMPLLQGETVRERLNRRGPVSAALACVIVAEVLEGLDAAHRAGLVHRDVKPANIFLPIRDPGGPARRSVLLDFGIAKLLGASGRATTEAKVVGTPRYLAPEQILGGCVDARTDVYAAGLTLFEMIAGRGPYDASSPMDLMRAHLEAKPRSLREFAPVSSELAHAIDRAIAKAPARRWPSARAFAAVLDRAAARETARAGQGDDAIVIDLEMAQ
ncbi:MAG: serine/threonine-protein kinase [Minicystis sp.]